MKKIYFLMLMIFISISTFAQQVTKEEFDQWLREANQGNAVSQRKVGICYERGYNVLQDNTKAVEWYQKAANQGDAIAQCLLGICYYLGKGVTKNYSKAVEWYQKAANQGLAGAQDCLGDCYHRGNGVTQNYTKAVEWYQKAANQGDASAQWHLGTCYEKGNGVTQNYAKAVEWYQKAANQGYALAQLSLGTCYYAGRGITKNYAKAVEWYQKAANQGNDAAQCLLGMCYQHGNGVTQNYAKAIEWYQKAARQGHNVAIGLLKSLNSEIEHTYVDLGLPSGTLWATCNIGAVNPEDNGDYFAWGETEPKNKYDWSTYKYANGDGHKLSKYCTKRDYGNNGFVDDKAYLNFSDDAAYQQWGSDWCMPTFEQYKELIDKCTWKWTTKNGKNGYIVIGLSGKSIFLPAADIIWGNNVNTRYYAYWMNNNSEIFPDYAFCIDFDEGHVIVDAINRRCFGLSVRPVRRNK